MTLLEEAESAKWDYPLGFIDFMRTLTKEQSEQLAQEMLESNICESDEYMDKCLKHYMFIKNHKNEYYHAQCIQNVSWRAVIPYKTVENDYTDEDYYAPTYTKKWEHLYTNPEEFNDWCRYYERDYANLKKKLLGDYSKEQRKNAIDNIYALVNQFTDYYDLPEIPWVSD